MSKSPNPIFSLFDKATSNKQDQQLEFVSHIPDILQTFPKEWIENQFIPFLTSWVPVNDSKVVSALIPFVPQIAISVGSLELISSLVEAIVSGGNKENNKELSSLILKMKISRSNSKSESSPQSINSSSCVSFLTKLSDSDFDCVRAFVPSLIPILRRDEQQKSIVTNLVYDESFLVRLEVAKLILRLKSDTLSSQIAVTLVGDHEGQIRAIVPIVSSKKQFYINSILPKLVSDVDWSVRTSVAKELVNNKSYDTTLNSSITLANDKVWQVKLCALRSMAYIIKKIKDVNNRSTEILNIFKDVIKYPQVSLKNAVIDAFLALFKKLTKNSNESTPNLKDLNDFITSSIVNQPPQSKLHFLEKIVASSHPQRILVQIKPILYDMVKSLTENDQWRIRLGAVEILKQLEIDEEQNAQFSALCLQLIKDESAPVREASAKQYALFILSSNFNGKLPKAVNELAKSDTFRKRQAAILIMKVIGLSQNVSPNPHKDSMKSSIKKFLKDNCSNVVCYAQSALEELQ